MTERAPRGPRNLLQQRFTPQRVRQHLIPRDAWRPYPPAGDRPGWEALSPETRQSLVRRGERHLGRAWEELPATLFLEFRRNGNRSRYEQRHHTRRTALADLILAECAEGQGRFLDDAINGIWALCEESFWGVPAHNARHSPHFPGSGLPDTSFHELDLFAAETGALLAWAHYLLKDEIERRTPEARLVLDRIVREVQTRMLAPYRAFDDWRWLGHVHRPVNNWNPWIHSNVLAANLLLETDEDVRRETVLRAIQFLDVFLDGYHDDGGCDEGPSYWGRAGASLFDCLEWLHLASSGHLDAYDDPLVAQIGRYIYRVHVGDAWYVNYADASARVYVEADLVYRYGRRIGDPRLMAHGAAAPCLASERAAQRGVERSGRGAIGRTLPELFNEPELTSASATAAPPLVRDAWLDGIQVLCAREREGSTDGLFLSAKGGHNAESHNHNDVGTFVVALDGHPVLIDVGVETYTRKTFSPERYEIWTMQSAYHNLPLVNGVAQSPGREFAARDVHAEVADAASALTLDLAAAYPPDAGLRQWRRSLRLDRAEHTVTLEDDYALTGPPHSLALHLMTSGPVDLSAPGTLRCETLTRPLLVTYPTDLFDAHVEEIAIDDARLEPVWGHRVFRVILEARSPHQEGRWRLTMRAA